MADKGLRQWLQAILFKSFAVKGEKKRNGIVPRKTPD